MVAGVRQAGAISSLPLSQVIMGYVPDAYYRLHADGSDSSGNGRNGTATNVTFGSTSLVPGDLSDKSGTFAGNARVEVAYASWMNFSQFTLWLRYKPIALSGTQDLICRHGTSGGQYIIRTEGTTVVGYIQHSNTWYPTTGGSTLVNGTTYTLSATYDGTTLRLYTNGVAAGSVAHTGISSITGAGTPLLIGCTNAAGYLEFANGVIDEAFVKGSALDATAQAALHAAAIAA